MRKELSLKTGATVDLLARLEEAADSLRMFMEPDNDMVDVASEHRAASRAFLNANVYVQILEALETAKAGTVVDYGPITFKATAQKDTWDVTGMPDGTWTLSKRFFRSDASTVAPPEGKGLLHLYESGGSYVTSAVGKTQAKAWLEKYRSESK
ncbi:hypothetical protein [Kitasatospora sp. NPDC056800]|uniref:hypothetical protein n=1 Tax=Kitasatospora sp. NPDC056800 TaxID=3345948 RepID=UPI0036A701A1